MKNSRKLLTTAFAATMLVGALAVSTPASAWHRWGPGWGWGYGGLGLGAGLATGLALGAAASYPYGGYGYWGSSYPAYYGYGAAATYPGYYGYYRRCYRRW